MCATHQVGVIGTLHQLGVAGMPYLPRRSDWSTIFSKHNSFGTVSPFFTRVAMRNRSSKIKEEKKEVHISSGICN